MDTGSSPRATPAPAEPRAARPGWRAAAASLGVLLVVAALHVWIFRDLRAWPDPDAPYHYQVMKEIWHGGPWFSIPWLPFTVLGEAGPDHHWLYHLLLAPFAALRDPILAAHAANAASFALVPASLYAALRLRRCPVPAFWTAACLGVSFTVAHRWSMLRAQTLASAYLVLFLAALAARRTWAILLLAFLFMESYHAALMLLVPAGIWTLLRLQETRRLDFLPLGATAGGLALGLLASPWFPRNIAYFLFHTFVKVGDAQGLDIGREWHPGDLATVFGSSWLQALLLLAVLVLARKALRRLSRETMLVALTLAFLAGLSLKHVRFVEYLPQLLVMTAALVARDGALRLPRTSALLLLPALSALMLLVGARSALALKAFRARSLSLAEARLRGVGRFLVAHAKPGALILNEDWSDFPLLVVQAPGLRYATGLDPYYLAHADPARAAILAKLQGRVPRAPGEVLDLRGAFGTDWVVARDPAAIELLAGSGQAKGAVRSDFAVVFYLGTDPKVLQDMTRLDAPRP